MKISFDPTTVTGAEVAGMLALLATVSPAALTEALASYADGETPMTVRIGDVSVTGTPAQLAAAEALPPAEPPPPSAGGPVPPPPPPSPAAVFGETPAPFAPSATEASSLTSETPAPAPATAPAGGQVDADGFPWDERIHAKSSSGPGGVLTGTGVWRAKRGVSKDLVKEVQAELKGPQAPAAPPPPPSAATPAPPPPPAPTPEVASAPAAAPPATPQPTAQTVTPAAPVSAGTGPTASPAAETASPSDPPPPPPVNEFIRIMRHITAIGANPADVNAAVQACGLSQLRDLTTASPEVVASFEATLNALAGAGAA